MILHLSDYMIIQTSLQINNIYAHIINKSAFISDSIGVGTGIEREPASLLIKRPLDPPHVLDAQLRVV